jgi:hypothetical protein
MCRPDEGQAFCARWAPGLTCLCDPTTAAYAAYGLRRGGTAELLGPAVWLAGVRAAARGFVARPARGDPRMLPGTFAIDAAGIVRAVHYARHSGDQPDLDALLAAMRP